MSTPQLNKEEVKKMGMKSLVGKKMKKNYSFMGEEIEITKLSTSSVLAIQAKAKEIEDDESKSLDVLKLVIVSSVEEAKDLSEEDYNTLPLDELRKLSEAIMEFSGLGNQATGK
jgi:hypothetical protein